MSILFFLAACAVLIRCALPDRRQLAAWRELERQHPANWPLTIVGIVAFMAVFWAVWTMLPA